MKKQSLLLFLISFCFVAMAQQSSDETGELPDAKNIVKLNLPALALKTVSVQYERAVGKRISVLGTFRYMPKGKLPFESQIAKIEDDPEFTRQLKNTKLGNWAIMPEVRFYVGKRGVGSGFYLAPYVNIARYDMSLPYQYDDNGATKEIPIAGNIHTLSGGLMMGAQWKLSKMLRLDWWILGPAYGQSKGTLSGQQSLSPSEQQSLRDELDQMDIPLTKFTYDVHANGASIFFKGPWAGIRTGIALGIAF